MTFDLDIKFCHAGHLYGIPYSPDCLLLFLGISVFYF